MVGTLSVGSRGLTSGLDSTALVQGLVSVTVQMGDIGNGSTGDGGRGGQKSSPHGN